ncbi:radical SAM protein [Deferribacter autotrophicus]|uniref:Radical SAM protein n=1 Tax=Deferribacter autotrophicus TaxID=500465 RepID=A0A5A8F7S6_9BACT|nr:radical SAM protein [Deferribacter autotrophicus]KAA0259509.1 radical SAM protein [Deferribacter autotrophicus]
MKFVFGPVPSRRLGASLGVNLVPHKICSFDCIYCEVGKTTELTSERRRFFKPEDLLKEFKIKYEKRKDKVDVVTFTGAGEPTLNIDLGYLAEKIKEIIDKPLAILTNSSLIMRDDVRRELMNFDIVVPSLDAVTDKTFAEVNKPVEGIKINDIIAGLKQFCTEFKGEVYIEVLLVKGVNDSNEDLQRLTEVLKDIEYTKVQLNTVFRPTAYKGVVGLSEKELLEKALFLSKNGVRVEPVGNYVKKLNNEGENIVEDVVELLKMRPCTEEDLILLFGTAKIKEVVERLIEKDMIVEKEHDGELFYFKK